MPEIFDASVRRQDQVDGQSTDPDLDPELSITPDDNPSDFIIPNDWHEEGDASAVHEPAAGENQLARNAHRPNRNVEDYSEVMRYEEPSFNPFDSFAPKPLQVFFDSQEKAERVLLMLRKHPITQVKWFLIALAMTFVPFLFSLVGLLEFLPERFQIAGLVLWYLIVTGFVLESLLTWFFNVYIITDERIIDVDFLSLIYKNISAAKIDNIEDVTAETGGAIRSVFNFGTVKIQTAGTNAELEFEDVPQPSKVTRFLNELMLEEEREKVEGRVN